MTGLLLISVALSTPPERPEPPPPIEGECPYALGLDIGTVVPTVLVRNDEVACAAVAVPLSVYQDLLLTEQWADALDVYVTIDSELRDQELSWYMARWELEQVPEPFWSRPGTMVALGILSGVACVLSSAWAIQQVSE